MVAAALVAAALVAAALVGVAIGRIVAWVAGSRVTDTITFVSGPDIATIGVIVAVGAILAGGRWGGIVCRGQLGIRIGERLVVFFGRLLDDFSAVDNLATAGDQVDLSILLDRSGCSDGALVIDGQSVDIAVSGQFDLYGLNQPGISDSRTVGPDRIVGRSDLQGRVSRFDQRDALARGQADCAVRGPQRPVILDMIGDHVDIAFDRLNVTVVNDSILRAAGKVERTAAHELSVADVQRGGDQATYVDLRAAADQDPVWIDQVHVAVGAECAQQAGRISAGDTIQNG